MKYGNCMALFKEILQDHIYIYNINTHNINTHYEQTSKQSSGFSQSKWRYYRDMW